MQYIQLQGQVAADLDLPLEGSYNLFIDTSDNSIKAKDSDGHMHGGGGLSLTELTRYELGQLVASASLTPGAFYKINGAASRSFLDDNGFGWNNWNNGTYSGGGNEIQDGGTTIILQATTDKTLSKKGIGLFYVPNYENPNFPTTPPDYNYLTWDNTHRIYLANVTGRFNIGNSIDLYSDNTENSTTGYLEGSLSGTSDGYVTFRLGNNDTFFQNPNNLNSLEISQNGGSTIGYIDGVDYTSSYSAGDKVIYGGRVWENLSGGIGYKDGGWPDGELYLNSEDWALVPFNETDYTIKADAIEYEFEYDNISYRSDGVNEVYSDWKWWDDSWGYNMIKFFPWGHHNVERVSISNSYLSGFVNFPYDSNAWNIKFEDGGGFNAHTWGHQSNFSNISGDKRAHFTGHDFGRGTDIYEIKLGIDSQMYGISTCDNQNQSYSQIYEITLGNNAYFGDFNMYYGSYIRDVEIGTTANLQYFDMYEFSNIRYGLNLDVDAYMNNFTLNQYSEIKYINLGIGSRITYFTLNYSSCLKRITLATDAYINDFLVGENGFIRQVNLSDRAYIEGFTIGQNSNLQNIDLGAYSSMAGFVGGYSSDYQNIRLDAQASVYNVDLGYNCNFQNIEIAPDGSISNVNASAVSSSNIQGISVGPYSSISNVSFIENNSELSYITLTNNAYLYNLELYQSSYISNINALGDTETGYITVHPYSSVSNFQIGVNAGVNFLTVTSSAALDKFELGVNSYINSTTFTSSFSDVTITKGFTNLHNAQIQDFNNLDVDAGSRPYIDINNRSIVTIDISGVSGTQQWALPDGQYEGQEITFVLKTDGTHTIGPDQINLWTNKLMITGVGYAIQTENGGSTYVAIRPFVRTDSSNGYTIWKNCTKAIWTGGIWVTDAEAYND